MSVIIYCLIAAVFIILATLAFIARRNGNIGLKHRYLWLLMTCAGFAAFPILPHFSGGTRAVGTILAGTFVVVGFAASAVTSRKSQR
jgi:hypothetical protein